MTRTIASRQKRTGAGRFVGRAREQELLRTTLRQLAALRERPDEELADDFYNCACLESIAGNADAAIEALRVALERGSDAEWAREDPDFVFIREDPRYRALVGLEPLGEF